MMNSSPLWNSQMCDYLFTYFPADCVFLLIKNLLLSFCNMATVLSGHIPLFLANHMVLFMEMSCLSLCYFPFLNFLIDAFVLII